MTEFFEFIRALNAVLTWPMVFFLGIVGFLLSVVAVKVYERAEHEYFMASMRVRGWQHDLKRRAAERKWRQECQERHQERQLRLLDAKPVPHAASLLPSTTASLASASSLPVRAISLRKPDGVPHSPVLPLSEEALARLRRESEESERRAALGGYPDWDLDGCGSSSLLYCAGYDCLGYSSSGMR